NSIATIVRLVTHGHGVAAMPSAVVRRELETGELHEVAVSPEFPPMELHAVTEISPRHSLRNEMAAMAQAAAERFAREWPGDYVFGDCFFLSDSRKRFIWTLSREFGQHSL